MLKKINAMAKRGRKTIVERKGYFYEAEEQAVIDYLLTNDENEKNRIFDSVLKPAFTKMVESIIRRYRLYVPDEEFDQTFDDTISFLITKLPNFIANKLNKEGNKTKAYSYCGTICKNYLLYKNAQFEKNQKRNISYSDIGNDFNDNNFSYEDDDNISFLNDLINKTLIKLEDMLSEKNINNLNPNEQKIGFALIQLLSNWEDLLATKGSNKFNKSSILYFLRETTLLNTKEVRDGMKKFKNLYYTTKGNLLEF